MEGRELPEGWSQAEIGDLCELRNGRAFKSSDWKETGVPIVRIQNLNNANASFNYYQGPIDERNRLQGGELLFAWSGTPGTSFGAHVWDGGVAVLNQHIFRVDFDESSIDKRFFRFAINQKLNELIDNAHGGVGLRHVTKGKFEKTHVAVPPFNEQRHIAAKLDTTLAAVDACRQRLDGVAAIFKRFRQAVLAAATSGELTRETAEESPWKNVSIAEVCEVVRGASPRPAGDKRFFGGTGSIPWITVGELTKDGSKHLLSTSCFLTEEGKARSRYIYPGTLLLTNSGATLGVPKITLIGGCINDGSVALLGLEEPLKSYIYCVLLSMTQALRAINQGAAQPNLNTTIVKDIRFKIPVGTNEQTEVVTRIEELLALADQLEAKLTAARKFIERLTPALLAKAFRGELVPQDPIDEPASVLLEKIRAARQVEAAAGKPSRRGRKKASANPEPGPLPAALASPDFLAQLLQECGALSERALLAASELDPAGFRAQLDLEVGSGNIRAELEGGKQVLIVAREE